VAPHDDRTAWLVKAGKRAKHARDFVTKDMVSIGTEWPGVGDLSTASDAEVFLAIEAAGRKKPADDLVQLRILSTRMTAGDIVVTPDVANGDLLFGAVDGEYEYSARPVVEDHHHSRPVSWFGRLTVDHLEPFLAKAVDWRGGTLRRLPEQTHWLRLAGEIRDGLGRPANDFPRIAKAAPAKRKTPSSTPRMAANPTMVVNPDQLCPSCGLLRAASMFPDGSKYCRDCD